MTEEQLFEVAYNAHERAEQAALEAMFASLRAQGVDALACLADPQWRWETRGSMSGTIIDFASEVLDEKLEALVGAVA
jgi:hypothetical protein